MLNRVTKISQNKIFKLNKHYFQLNSTKALKKIFVSDLRRD